MMFSKLCVTFSNTASEQAMLVLVVMSTITKELEKHVIKKLHMCTEYLIWIEWNLKSYILQLCIFRLRNSSIFLFIEEKCAQFYI